MNDYVKYTGVIIPGQVADGLAAYCRSEARREACGLLTGYCSEGSVVVTGFTAITNRSPEPEKRFAFDPEEWISAVYRMEAQSKPKNRPDSGIVGIFHSHPDDPAVPSAADRELEWDLPTCAIISLQKKEPLIRCYSPRHGEQWREQGLMIRNGSDGHTARPDS